MFVSWWLIVPAVVGVGLLFKMVSRLANEVDRLEIALEDSKGKLETLNQFADEFKQANLRMTDSLIQAKCCIRHLAGSIGPEQEKLLLDMNEALSLATSYVITNPNFIEHGSTLPSALPQPYSENQPLSIR